MPKASNKGGNVSETKKPRAKKVAAKNFEAPTVVAIKGMNHNMTCRGFKFESGRTYEIGGKVKACQNGFHSCPVDDDGHPLSVFEYYAPGISRYFEVEASGETDRQGNKIASAKLTIGVEITLGEIVARAIKWVFDRAKPEGAASATGHRGAASATGSQGAASATGDYGAASATGYQGAASATGSQGAASATGSQGAASATGSQGAASATGSRGAASATGSRGAASATGDYGAASATGDYGAASATGYQGAASATGDYGAASATGDYGAASATGSQGAASATGEKSGAVAFGYGGRVKGAVGNALFALERDDDLNIVSTASGIVGRDGIEPDTWYRCESGKLVAA
jgi:hypothetical protein